MTQMKVVVTMVAMPPLVAFGAMAWACVFPEPVQFRAAVRRWVRGWSRRGTHRTRPQRPEPWASAGMSWQTAVLAEPGRIPPTEPAAAVVRMVAPRIPGYVRQPIGAAA